MPNLSVEYLGLRLANPLIVSSSGLTSSAAQIRKCAEAGAGAVVMKSIFEEDIRRRDNTFQDTLMSHPELADYLNAEVGLRYGPREYCEEIRKAKDQVAIPVIASINCAEPRWWIDYAAQLEASGADGIELNLSVPSVHKTMPGYQSEEIFAQIVSAVCSQVRLPVAVKLSGQLTNPAHVARLLFEAGARALVVFNRQSSLDIDIQQRRTVLFKADRGLTDLASIYYPLRWISILHEEFPEAQLSASGGVHSGEAVIKYLLAGATTVQVCSLLYRRGLGELRVLLGELEAYLEQQQAESLEQIRGSARRELSTGSREQQRAEYLGLAQGPQTEVDTTDGDGLIFESHPQR